MRIISLVPNGRLLEIVRPATGETFRGWWRREGGWVLTVVADPAPASPECLT